MNKEILYRFFEGEASYSEEKQIKLWLDASETNRHTFLQERQVYDALMLIPRESTLKQRNKFALIPWITSAASIALLLIVSGLYFIDLNTDKEQYNTILVPPGQRINLILADNSHVWLNANTTFRYPTQFSKKNRTVYLDGEAYFDVTTNKKKPFIVNTEQGYIQVTGTSFNVEAYSKHKSFETSLFEGGVDIYKNNTKLASLKPTQKATIRNNKLIVSRIDDSDKYLWKNGLIAFNNKKLDEILLSLEKYFNVKIQINTITPQHTYTGKFRQSDGIDYALRVLQKNIQFNFERDEQSGTIYIK